LHRECGQHGHENSRSGGSRRYLCPYQPDQFLADIRYAVPGADAAHEFPGPNKEGGRIIQICPLARPNYRKIPAYRLMRGGQT
jgi:hypothetical protein